MKSATYLALLSAIVRLSEAADLAPEGPDVLISKIEEQIFFPEDGPILDAHEPLEKEYEYIVIGSGAGGSPLAANLARAGHTVLLVDAGGDYGHQRQVETAGLANPASERNEVTWSYFTHHYEDEEMTLKDRKLSYLTPDGDYYSGRNPPEGSTVLGNYYPRYGGLGGCTEHNDLVGLLPTKNDLAYLANITGDPEWELENMRKYFVKLENAGYPDADPSIHGHDGYLNLNINPEGIAAQDVKLMSALIGAARGFFEAGGEDTAVIDAVEKAVTDCIDVATKSGIDPYSELIPLEMTKEITDLWANVVGKDPNTDALDRDTARLFTRLPEMMDNVNYRRSSPRDYVFDTATAVDAKGNKKYPLEVALHTLVTKVTFKNGTCGGNPRATGIEYLYGQSLYRADPRSNTTDTGKPGTVRATKEVIVSGGTFNSPQILKLSGVGPKEELEQWGIPVVKDLPGVGTNLQDRLEVSVNGYYPTNFSRILDCTFLADESDPCWVQYANTSNKDAAKGTYAVNGNYVGIFWPSSYSEDGEQDLWIGGFPGTLNGFFPGFASSAATPEFKNYWTWLILKAHTRNRAGTVKLRSADPRDTPVITFHSLYEGLSKEEADKDALALVEGMRMAQKFYDSTPNIDGLPTQWWPPTNYTTDEQLKDWVTEEAWGHHAAGSNYIGADDDPMAVLDSKFRVRGVDGLRVVDASVFPKIPGTFITVPILMAAEKASADILKGN